MLRLSFIYPGALWLLLVLVPLWALALLVPRRLSPWRFWSSLGLRTALILALVLSLAGTQLVYGVDNLTTVFLIDGSDSVSPSARAQAEQFVQDALNHMQPDDRAAVVVFGENALVERAPGSSTRLGRIDSVPVATRTNIEEAIQLGLALFPADSQKRLVLLSDGGENTGNALASARLAAAGNVPIEVVNLSIPDSSGEALVTNLEAPSHARDGQEIELTATVESNVAQTARVRVFADQEVIVDQVQELQVGTNRLSVTVQPGEPGFQRYRVQIEPQNDARVQNNEAAVLVQVQGPPRVLLVEGEAGEARNLQDALDAANVAAERVAPDAMPTDLAGLSAYEAVVLVNVPARELPVKVMGILPGYVRDLGKGLIMIGGDDSFGVGGYGRTPLEEALPVYMDVRDRQERPNLALVFAIDKSGSMDACHCSGPNRRSAQFQQGGERKVDIAKLAVTEASALLSEQDTLGIVAFDDGAHWVMPATTGPAPDLVEEAVSSVEPRGSTNVRVGLLEAERMLQNTDARIKHVILLTDGWGGGGNNLEIAERMREQGITLTVVAAGSGSANYLEDLAIAGGGRYYPAEDMGEVPEIFLQETITAVGNYIIEEPFFPAIAADSPILNGFEDGFPQLYGYNGSTIKDTARNVLVADDQSPVLAQWQYGLGRSIAWTSDAKGQWARNWVRWEQFPRFAAQLVGWVIPEQTAQNVSTDVHVENAQTIIDVVVRDNNGNPQEDLRMTASLIREGETENRISLTQVAPGEYRASVPSPAPGTYLVQLSGQQEGRTIVQEVAGLVVPYSPEYRQNQSNPALLLELMELTGGRQLSAPEDAFLHNLSSVARAQEIALPLLLVALLLVPADIAVRRLMLRRKDVAESRIWMRTRLSWQPRPAAPPDPTLARLSSAKQRVRGNADRRSPAPDQPANRQPPVTTSPESTGAGRESAPDTERNAQTADDPLERLREAKARARRRARGEE